MQTAEEEGTGNKRKEGKSQEITSQCLQLSKTLLGALEFMILLYP